MCVVKSLSSTRRSIGADATKALCKGYSSIRTTLSMLQKDHSRHAATRAKAVRLEQNLSQLEITRMTIVWNKIFTRLQTTGEFLQG